MQRRIHRNREARRWPQFPHPDLGDTATRRPSPDPPLRPHGHRVLLAASPTSAAKAAASPGPALFMQDPRLSSLHQCRYGRVDRIEIPPVELRIGRRYLLMRLRYLLYLISDYNGVGGLGRLVPRGWEPEQGTLTAWRDASVWLLTRTGLAIDAFDLEVSCAGVVNVLRFCGWRARIMWTQWKGDAMAVCAGLALSVIVPYLVGAVLVLVSSTLRCEDQCQMDRIYGVSSDR